MFLVAFHDAPTAGHLGVEKTLSRLRDRVIWPKMRNDVAKHVGSCDLCQHTKIPRQRPQGYMSPFTAEQPLQVWAADLMGPYPATAKGFKFLLVFVDLFSKYVEAFPLRSATATAVCDKTRELFSRWGAPRTLFTDNGPQFKASKLAILCATWGVTKTFTAAYHPQPNVTERYNQTLKTMIKAYLEDNHRQWDTKLPELLFALRSARNRSTGSTPFELLLTVLPRAPTDSVLPEALIPSKPGGEVQDRLEGARRELSRQSEKRSRYVNRSRRHAEFHVGDLVLYRSRTLSDKAVGETSRLSQPWIGPVKILDKSHNIYTLDLGPRRSTRLHAQDLKRYVARRHVTRNDAEQFSV